MASMIGSFISGHGIVVAIALFTAFSTILNAVATYLTSIGDQVPSWLGTIIGGLGSAVHFLNGNVSAASVTTSSTK